MNSSFLYHAWGLYTLECTREEYKGNTIILHVQTKERRKSCPKCGKLHLVRNGYRMRDFVGLPIGGKKVVIRMKVQRYKCRDCDYDQQERMPFATGSRSYTHRFAKYVVELHKVLKGTRYLLLGNGADIFDKQHKTRLDNALAMNEPLSKAYYLKEQLRQIWVQPVKAMGESVFDDWVRQAEQSKIPQLQKKAVTMRAYKAGILAWYDCHLSTGKVEGINNKIKVMKRNAYGFRDDRYFTLRLYALHDCRITRNVGCTQNYHLFLNYVCKKQKC